MRDFSRQLLRWYDASRRALPWRIAAPGSPRPDPYHVLVSELMLQQTQVATVIPYFHRFLETFPTLADLAAADEQQVLRLWQGLGYYARARNLQAAAKAVVAEHGGQLPQDLQKLLGLPGVGRYTAGAIASIAFDQKAPILDGNVQRVLCRLDAIDADPRGRKINAALWRRAEDLLPNRRVGDFNSGLMELGAMICTPRAPQCLLCPVASHCKAAALGLQQAIPAPRPSRPLPLCQRNVYCICHDGRYLIEQRPMRGRWAGMWQFITVDADDADVKLPVPLEEPLVSLGQVNHTLTHRRYQFKVTACSLRGKPVGLGTGYRWTDLEGLAEFPLPRPHVKIAQMLAHALLSAAAPHGA